jgi:hypothetical protein
MLYTTHGFGSLIDSRKVTKTETHDQLTIRKTAQEINNCDLSERRREHDSQPLNVNQKCERQAKHERRHLLKLSARLLEQQRRIFWKNSNWYRNFGPPVPTRNKPKCPIQSPWDQKKKKKTYMHVKIEGQNHVHL